MRSPPTRLNPTRIAQRFALRSIRACVAVAAVGISDLAAQAHRMASAPPGQIESGAPQFTIRSHEALGLDAPPTDLHVLPDGRLLVIGVRQIALGDGVRWESFQQALHEATSGASSVNVSADGTIFMGVPGGFARVSLGADARWSLLPVADWQSERVGQQPVLRTAIRVDDEWFWHGDSGPLVAWRPGETARTIGRADTIEQVLRLRDDLFLSDRTNGRLWRLSGTGGMDPVEFTSQISASETLTCGVRFGDELLVGTYARGLRLFDGKRTRPFVTEGRLADDQRVNDLCTLGNGFYAAAIEGYGILFFNTQGRIVQVLDRSLDRRLSQVRRLQRAGGGVLVGLLSDGVLRVEFPSRVSNFEPLVSTSLTTGHPYRFEGQLWLMADGNMHRAMYDKHGRMSSIEVDTPPGRFVFSFSSSMGRPTASTDRGAFFFDRGTWKSFAPDSVNLRVLDPKPVGGRWLYGAIHEVGWLRPTATGIEVETLPAPALDNPYNVETDRDGSVWVEQGNGRLARVRVVNGKPEVEAFDRTHGVPEGWAQVFKIDDRVGFNIGGQILRFDEATHRIVPDETFAKRFPGLGEIGGRPIRDALGRLWVTANGGVQVLEGSEGALRNRGERMPSGFQPYYFTCEDNGVVWMHGDRRLARFDPDLPAAPDVPIRALLTRVGLPGSGRTLFSFGERLRPFDYADNSLDVHFVASHCPFGASVDFEVMLEAAGVEQKWVAAGGAGSAVFNHLKEGDYVLHVRPRASGTIGEAAKLGFTIRPPWYRSPWAYAAYLLTAIAAVVLSGRVASFLQRRENARLERLVAQRTLELNAGIERRLRLEAQLLQAQKLESLGTLAGGIAHDFNNLLTSILGFCELALLNAGHNDAVKADLAEIRTAGNRARELVAQILTFSRKGNVKLVALDLAQPVGEALKLIRRSTPATVEIDARLTSGTVLADATQVQQVVLNLCNNAVHAMRDRPGRLQVALEPLQVDEALAAEVAGLGAGPAMRLAVTDNGRGMDTATLERIFDPFFTTKRQGEGTGLGLSIVQGIVHSHRGSLRVRSTPGAGTTFEIFIPRTEAPISAQPAANGSTPHGEKQEILVVDDERPVALFVAKRLEQLGYRTAVFHEPRAALTAANAAPGRFHAIITDLTMPGLIGTELIRQIRLSTPDLPAVIITGYGTDTVRSALENLPRCLVLPKPFEGDDLARALSEVLRTSR